MLSRGSTPLYLLNGGLLEDAQQMAAHESARTTKLYDRRSDEISLDEVGLPTVSGQKTTLSRCGIGPSQRAKTLAMLLGQAASSGLTGER